MAESNDLLKKIKGLFIVEDTPSNGNNESSTTSAETTTTTNQTQNTTTTNPVYIPPVTPTVVSGGQNQKVYDSLSQALESNNMQGFDYLEFRGSLLSLSKMPLDEATRFQSAYAMAQTMGADVNKLIDTAQHYLNVLKNEELKFQQALQNQQKNGMDSREQEIVGLQNAINQKAELIKQITSEIEQHQAKITEIKQQINESASKIAQAQSDFQVTYQSLVDQINGDISNIQKYLK